MTSAGQFASCLAVVCILLGVLLAWRHRNDVATRGLYAVAPIALFCTGFTAWAAFRLVPHWTWSAARLAASVRLAEGFPLYTPPGSGAINGWIYGPISAIAYLPAALVHEPLAALRVAAGLNALFFLLPVVALCGRALLFPQTRLSAFMIGLFGIAALLAPFGTWYSAAALGSDVTTTTLGSLSCVVLARKGRLPVAAALLVLAIWAKQIEAPLVLAQALFLAHRRGLRPMWIYVGWVTFFISLTTLGFVAWFGGPALWHCLVTIPGRHAIDFSRLGPLGAAFGIATWWVWAVALAAQRLSTPAERRSDSDWAACSLFLLASLTLLPGGMAAAAKAGGDQNSLHSIVYAVLAGLAAWWKLIGASRADIAARARLALAVGILPLLGISIHRIFAHDHLALVEPGVQHREAFNFAKRHPGQAYFPCNPLVTLLAERRDYPFDYGLYDWRIAGEAPDPAKIRSILPQSLTFIVYHEKDPSREMLRIFPEFRDLRQSGPWDIFVRNTPAPTPAAR